MKFSDLSTERSIIDEAPVGLGQRAKTKIKKALSPRWNDAKSGIRHRMEGQDIIETAANSIGKHFHRWRASLDNPKEIPLSQLKKFFTQVGFAKTANKVLQNNLKVERFVKNLQDREREEQQKQQNKQQDQQQELSLVDERVIHEANEFSEPVFSVKEVEQIILQVVETVAKENFEGLALKVKKEKAKKSMDPGVPGGETLGTDYDPDPYTTEFSKEDVVDVLKSYAEAFVSDLAKEHPDLSSELWKTAEKHFKRIAD